MFISLLLVAQSRKLPSEKKSALGYSANSKVLMVSFMSRSGLERMTTKVRRELYHPLRVQCHKLSRFCLFGKQTSMTSDLPFSWGSKHITWP